MLLCGLFCSCGEQGLHSSCSAHGMWDLPRPGIKPMSPTLAGGLLTTKPPGKPLCPLIYLFIFDRAT